MVIKDANTQQKLDLLISRTPSEPTTVIPPIIPEIPPPSISHKIRPATPPDFDGDRTKGLAFLNSCQTYIRLCSEDFQNEQIQIVWAMSYMKTGRAEKWAARIFWWEQDPANQGKAKFSSWEGFRVEFKNEFCPSHVDSAAINHLESTAYFQKSRSVDDYLDEFQDLISDAGYSDPKTVVVSNFDAVSTSRFKIRWPPWHREGHPILILTAGIRLHALWTRTRLLTKHSDLLTPEAMFHL